MLFNMAIIVLVLYGYLGFKKAGYALITMPIAVTVLAITSAHYEDGASAIISLCIIPVTLIAILFMRYEDNIMPWPKRGAKTAIITFIMIGLVIGFFAISSSLGVVGIGFLGLLFGYVIGVSVTQRNATTAFVISTIGASIRQNLPLPMALQSAADNIKYEHSQILLLISRWLVKGYSLSESMKRGFKKCPGWIMAMIAAGEKTGQVPLVVQSIEADLLEKADESKRVRPMYPAAYIITVLIVMSFIAISISIGILPRFSQTLNDIGVGHIPKSTQILIGISNFIYYEYGWLIIIGIIFFSTVIYVKVRFCPRRPEKPLLLSRIGDFIKWHLPILHWFENNYSTLQVVEGLRIFLNAGNTINTAIRGIIDLDVNCCFRKKLIKWLKQIEAGDDIASAARQCGLAHSLSWAFEQQENPENTLPVLEMLESVYRSNYSYRINLARFILLPCTTICMGAMVGFVVYSIFSVMIAIISQYTSLV
jgi:general secretion pathway protein F